MNLFFVSDNGEGLYLDEKLRQAMCGDISKSLRRRIGAVEQFSGYQGCVL